MAMFSRFPPWTPTGIRCRKEETRSKVVSETDRGSTALPVTLNTHSQCTRKEVDRQMLSCKNNRSSVHRAEGFADPSLCVSVTDFYDYNNKKLSPRPLSSGIVTQVNRWLPSKLLPKFDSTIVWPCDTLNVLTSTGSAEKKMCEIYFSRLGRPFMMSCWGTLWRGSTFSMGLVKTVNRITVDRSSARKNNLITLQHVKH